MGVSEKKVGALAVSCEEGVVVDVVWMILWGLVVVLVCVGCLSFVSTFVFLSFFSEIFEQNALASVPPLRVRARHAARFAPACRPHTLRYDTFGFDILFENF
jgi:hypothetical protein